MAHAVFTYDATEWLLFFYVYCFFGWIFESTYVSLCERRFVNRGFLRGPFLPLYGSGAVLMLFVSIPVEDSAVLVYVFGCAAATALEYVTGTCMEALFKVRYWDYSGKRFQYKGRICLSSTLAWGGLTLLLVRVIHRPVERLVLGIPDTAASVLAHVLTVVVSVDAALSVRAALDVRDLLVRMTALREELATLQRRADVLAAVLHEDRRERREELEQLKLRLEVGRERLHQARQELHVHGRKLLGNSPSATSSAFREAFRELREELQKIAKGRE